ncbi:MAG: PEP-CTERM sorting domain-containing protein [Pseudomonadota bacterium]
MNTSDGEHHNHTDRLGRDIRWLSTALAGSLLVVVLMSEAAAQGPASSVVPVQSDIARAITLELESPILRTQERVVLEPTIMGLMGSGLVLVAWRRRSRLSRRR